MRLNVTSGDLSSISKIAVGAMLVGASLLPVLPYSQYRRIYII